jgi:hypothetical protein
LWIGIPDPCGSFMLPYTPKIVHKAKEENQ